nr:MAG TPA: hypothetical protein [Caudoviricetes sp.]
MTFRANYGIIHNVKREICRGEARQPMRDGFKSLQ